MIQLPDRAATLPELLGRAAAQRPDSIALLAPGRPGLTYRELAAHAAAVQGALSGFGLGRQERVALVLPSGPEMATAFLGVACSAVCAPLKRRGAVQMGARGPAGHRDLPAAPHGRGARCPAARRDLCG